MIFVLLYCVYLLFVIISVLLKCHKAAIAYVVPTVKNINSKAFILLKQVQKRLFYFLKKFASLLNMSYKLVPL